MKDTMPCADCGARYSALFVEDLSSASSLWTFPMRCRDCDPAAWPAVVEPIESSSRVAAALELRDRIAAE